MLLYSPPRGQRNRLTSVRGYTAESLTASYRSLSVCAASLYEVPDQSFISLLLYLTAGHMSHTWARFTKSMGHELCLLCVFFSLLVTLLSAAAFSMTAEGKTKFNTETTKLLQQEESCYGCVSFTFGRHKMFSCT